MFHFLFIETVTDKITDWKVNSGDHDLWSVLAANGKHSCQLASYGKHCHAISGLRGTTASSNLKVEWFNFFYFDIQTGFLQRDLKTGDFWKPACKLFPCWKYKIKCR